MVFVERNPAGFTFAMRISPSSYHELHLAREPARRCQELRVQLACLDVGSRHASDARRGFDFLSDEGAARCIARDGERSDAPGLENLYRARRTRRIVGSEKPSVHASDEAWIRHER